MGDNVATLTIIAVNILKRKSNLKPIRYDFCKKKINYHIKPLDVYKIEELDPDDMTFIHEIKPMICLLWLCGISIKQKNLCLVTGTTGNKHVGSLKELSSCFEKCEINKILLNRYFKGEWDYFKNTAKDILNKEGLDEVRKFAHAHDKYLINWIEQVEKRYRDFILT